MYNVSIFRDIISLGVTFVFIKIKYFFKNTIRKFNDTPIFIRLLTITFLVFLFILLLSFISFTIFRKDKEISTFKMVTQTNRQAMSKIDDYIKDISNITKFPLTYKQSDFTYLTELDKFNNTNSASYPLQIMNEQMFNDILGYKNNINSCFIFNLQGNGDYKTRTSIYQPFNPFNEGWFKDSIDKFGKPITIDTYKLPYTADTKKTIYVFGISRGIVKISSNSVVGVLLVNTNIDYLRDICNNMKITPRHRIIITHNNFTIYDSVEENLATETNQDISSISWANTYPDTIKTVSINGEKLFASSISSNTTGWRLISLVPANELFKDLNEVQNIYILFTAIILIIATILIFLISRQIANPIKKLVALMSLTEDGDFDVKININSKDEIGMLADSFNSMIEKINNLIHEVYINKIKQGELEIQMLQSQINPHFIYNTLESISMMATINDDDTTSDMASALGSILRYGISNYNTEVLVKDEINNLEQYILLQDIRFNSMYTISINIDPNIESLSMIKLILQPIVENAIYHGMKNVRSNGKIEIIGDKDGEILNFYVIDNGKGMDSKQTELLNGYINDQNNSFKSIGLRNVNKRLKLRYGDNYGLFISSDPLSGTKVHVKLPCVNS